MNKRIPISQMVQHIGHEVTISGWLHNFRQLKHISFLILRDVSGVAQIVLNDSQLIETVSQLNRESVLRIRGNVLAVEQAPGGIEIQANTIEVLSKSTQAPVFDLFRPTIEAHLPTLLDNATLSLRHPQQQARWKIAALAMAGFRQTLGELSFTEIQTPKIVATATESGANVFEIDYFGQSAYLAQSPQFYKQMMVGVYERVFEVGPVFRAEPHTTTRHLSQYTSLDAEMGFIDNHHDVMAVLTEVIRGMLSHIQIEAQKEVELLEVSMPLVPETIPYIHFSEAQEQYFQATGEDCREEPDLSPEQERWLGQWAQSEYQSDFLFVIGYPMRKRPFYTHPDTEKPEYSNSFDLLFRGVELVTGGQRLHHHADYLKACEQWEIDPELISGYLSTFANGMPPHGGFAIGLERFVAQLTASPNVRLTSLFPRDTKRLTP